MLPDRFEALPAPVARYLRSALPDGPRPIARARVRQSGEFLMRPPGGWRPFRAVQTFTAAPPGFVWDARIRLLPGVRVHVVDTLRDGQGAMRATALGGLVTLAASRGTPEMAAGSLHRYLAEAVLLPTALLPGGGVEWAALDAGSARAALAVGPTRVTLDFRFGADGLVESVYTPARMRDVDGRGVPTPWQGRWAAYESHDGVLAPRQGEVEWLLPAGAQPYCHSRIDGIAYDDA